ncbi:MAG: helicase-related protein, partial [Pseudomonadota bacterium]
LAPNMRRIGLSATVADETAYRRWLSPREGADVTLVRGQPRKQPDIQILEPERRIPWSGHTATHGAPELYALIKQHQMTIIFVNTRSQTEMIFRALWDVNEDDLPIGMHHGSLDVAQRRKVESAMASGKLRAVIATASLDLGLDWGAVDLVVQIGAPKGASRLLQRIGRSNHRFDAASKAVLAPGNRFEYLEAQSAIDAIREGDLDGDIFKRGAYDVLSQHIMGMACAEAFFADDLYAEVITAAPFRGLERATFDDAIAFVENGGYSLRRYDRFQRIIKRPDGRYVASNRRIEHLYRMNAGAIIDQPGLKVKFRTGRALGEVDEWYASTLAPGDTFFFGGRVLEVDRIEMADLYVKLPSKNKAPRIPTYQGARMPLSTNLANRVRGYFDTPERWHLFPDEVRDWLELQQRHSELPPRDGLLVETFPQETRYGPRHFIVAYGFEGYNAHHTLGMLVTRRMEHMGYAPIGFVGTDYVLAAWSMKPVTQPEPLFSNTILQDELMEWVGASSLLKRAFMEVAQISGLVERNQPGQKKTGRQMMFSSDLIYDVLKKYEPDHVLMKASWQDAKGRLTDIERLASFLERIQGKITHREMDRISPLAVPAVVELNVQSVDGEAREMLFSEAEDLLRIAVSGA